MWQTTAAGTWFNGTVARWNINVQYSWSHFSKHKPYKIFTDGTLYASHNETPTKQKCQ